MTNEETIRADWCGTPPSYPYSSFVIQHSSLHNDVLDRQAGQFLAVAGLAAVALLRLHLEDDDLIAAMVLSDHGDNLRAGHDRGADANLRALAADHQHAVEFDLAAGLGGQELDIDRLPDAHAILLASGLDDSVHRSIPSQHLDRRAVRTIRPARHATPSEAAQAHSREL